MRTALIALAMGLGLAAPAFAEQGTAAGASGSNTPTAQGPDTGKARSTPSTTVIPGSSTTGNATAPGGETSAAQSSLPAGNGAMPQGRGGTGATTSPVVPSPAQ